MRLSTFARRRSIELRALAISIVTTLGVLACGFVLLYQFNVEARTIQLVEMARAQARLMEAVAKFDAFFQSSEVEGAARSASLSQFRESHRRYSGFGNTGEIVLAERQGSEIVFLLPTRKRNFRVPPPIHMETAGAAPMKLALAGQSGTLVGADHLGEEVLAAYEWLPFLEMGLVCKIDMVEIRAPFIRAALITVAVTLVLLFVGALLTSRMISPLVQRLESAKAGLEHELRVAGSLAEEAHRQHEVALLGDSTSVCGLRQAMERYARNAEPLLLTGPPGAGQQAVARGIHRQSERSNNAFIYFDCARLSAEDTSSVFGARMAEDGGQGLATLAHQGTLYLENVQDLPRESQTKLLDYVKRSARQRAKGEPVEPDVRIIAYSAMGLDEAQQDGRVDPALVKVLGYHRLAVPSLAERRDDIRALAERIVHDRARMRGQVFEGIEPESFDKMMGYAWPGNVTELSSVLERSLALSKGTRVEIRDELLDHTTHLGQYRLQRLIGSGGMADVWLATHDILARPAALKLIGRGRLAMAGGSREVLERRFEQEARVTARLRSPHTVELYDFGISDSGEFYYVMEYLEGMDLGQLIREGGAMEAERVVHFLAQACLSLEEAHQEGLVHRDIKPSNLFVCRLGTQHDFLKVLDFGIVKLTDAAPEHGPMTQTGVTPGTPNYLAPEVALGKTIDPKSDVYALGCVAYWLLTGREVFQVDSNLDAIRAHAAESPTAPSTAAPRPIPEELDDIVLRCLDKDPARRPTAVELRPELMNVPLAATWTEERAKSWWSERADKLGDGLTQSDLETR